MTHCEVIIVIWRWPNSPKVEKYQISGSSSRYLYTVYFDAVDLRPDEERQEQTHREVKAIFDEFTSSKIPVRFLLLVHEVQTFSFKQLHDFLNNQVVIVRIRKFSGGVGFIYFDAKHETGLINTQFGLVKSVAYSVGNGDIREKRLFNIFDQNGSIKEKSFILVWKYYLFLVKTQLFEVYELIMTQVSDQLNNIDLTLHQFAQQQRISKLNTFFAHFDPKRKADIESYISERVVFDGVPKKALALYRALFWHLELPMNTPGFLPTLNKKFMDVINLF